MPKKELGLYEKFTVIRNDGKHPGAKYFVLDLDHDPIARAVAYEYAKAASDQGYAKLANDLNNYLSGTTIAHRHYMKAKEAK